MGALRHSVAALTAVAGAPLVAGVLALRPSWRVGFRERLGALPRDATGSIWIHAASIGEMLAAVRLADRLRDKGHGVFTSSVTLTGRDVMRRRRPSVPCHLAPLDHPWCVDAALERVKPAALVLIETELWPCWIATATQRGIPVVLVSGRVSDRSYPRYRRLERVVRPTLAKLRAVGARSESDVERFCALGADPQRVSVTGDLKLEGEADPPVLAPELARVLGEVPLFVAGSTHPGEEASALAALAAAERAGQGAALLLAPRHPARAREVERLVEASGRPLRRRSDLGTRALGRGEVLVLDTVGELATVYGRAAVAFVGGSLTPHGGHNILEPAFAGRPVLYGRHTANFRNAVEILEGARSGRCVEDESALGRAVTEALANPEEARERGQRGRRALMDHCGSADRSATLIESVLSPRPVPAS